MSLKLLTLRHPSKVIQGTVQLTGSKSESNRALIIRALSQGTVSVENLSAAADTVIMNNALSLAEQAHETGNTTTIDIGPAGTAMRFLISYLNLAKGNFILTGTERMLQRRIGLLADDLQSHGANIAYAENPGLPPLKNEGGMTQQ